MTWGGPTGEDGTMRKGTLSVALAACLVAFSAGAVSAETDPGAPAADHELRVVNRYGATVSVYVQDADGALHMLGRVGASDFKILKVPEAITAKGRVHIEVYPVAPFESLIPEADGIVSGGFELDGSAAANMYVECDLLRSVVEIPKG